MTLHATDRRSGRHVPRTCRPSSRWCTSWPSTSGPPTSATSPRSSCTRPCSARAPALFGHVAVDADDRCAVGFALWFLNFSTWEGVHGIYLEDLYVRPAARGTGAGRALLATLAAICVERGYRRLDWWVLRLEPGRATSTPAIGAEPMTSGCPYRLGGAALEALAATGRDVDHASGRPAG